MINILRRSKSYIAVNFNLPVLYSINSFSQDGEDIILQKLFKNINNGFYVDVGAHHPFRYSNTQALYLKGWSGINIEPTPNNIHLFDKTRKRDTNIQTAVGKKKGNITLYCFEDSALNTTSKRAAEKTIKSKQSKLLSKVKVKVDTLEHILDNKVRGKQIDFLNVDIEGQEMEVLQSNNWKRYSPKIIVVENLKHSNTISGYLNKKSYKLIEKTNLSEIYKLIL